MLLSFITTKTHLNARDLIFILGYDCLVHVHYYEQIEIKNYISMVSNGLPNFCYLASLRIYGGYENQ